MIPCISYISFTTDFWSSNSSGQFLSLTGHCAFDHFYVQVVVLYAQRFTERHIGVNITETIDTMNEEYSIPDYKVHCIAVAWLIVEPVGPHRWCEGTLGVKKSTEETVGIALN